MKLMMTFLFAASMTMLSASAEDGGCKGKKKDGCKKDEPTLLVEGCQKGQKGKKKDGCKKDEATLLAEGCDKSQKKGGCKKGGCKKDEPTVLA